MELLRIGEFAELSHLSLKALRLYDELGLLAPARVDRDSGYRWYTRGQLDRARLVMRLRRLGMPLARIAAIVDTPAAETANQLDAYWAQVETDHAARRDLVGTEHDREPASAPRQVFIADLGMARPDDQVCDLAVPLR